MKRLNDVLMLTTSYPHKHVYVYYGNKNFGFLGNKMRTSIEVGSCRKPSDGTLAILFSN